jgi:hypothetical protein
MLLMIGGLLISALALYYWLVVRKTKIRNRDPRQQRLARLFIDAVSDHTPFTDGTEIVNFVVKQFDWSKSETRSRVFHALSIVKASALPYVYQRAKSLAQNILSSEPGGEVKQ